MENLREPILLGFGKYSISTLTKQDKDCKVCALRISKIKNKIFKVGDIIPKENMNEISDLDTIIYFSNSESVDVVIKKLISIKDQLNG